MTLPKTTFGLAATLVVVAAVAWRLGGSLGAGLMLGSALGAFLAGVAVAWQAHWLRVQPARVHRAQMEGLAVKLAAAVVFTLMVRSLPQLAERVEWRSFLLAFSAQTVIVLPLATWDLSKYLARNARVDAPSEARRIA